MAKTNYEKLIILSKYAVCDSKKLKFIKKQEAKELSSSLGLKIPLSKIRLLVVMD